MTKKQGDDINGVFRANKFAIDSLYVRNGLLVNHVLKYDSVLKESVQMNILLDSILSSETAAYQREISQQLKRDKKANKIMGVSWFLFFFLYLL
jgi:hypothetical protein